MTWVRQSHDANVHTYLYAIFFPFNDVYRQDSSFTADFYDFIVWKK